jgi:hypothetical protein
VGEEAGGEEDERSARPGPSLEEDRQSGRGPGAVLCHPVVPSRLQLRQLLARTWSGSCHSNTVRIRVYRWLRTAKSRTAKSLNAVFDPPPTVLSLSAYGGR